MVKINSANRVVQTVYIFNLPKVNLDLYIFIRRSHPVNIPHTQQNSNLQKKKCQTCAYDQRV